MRIRHLIASTLLAATFATGQGAAASAQPYPPPGYPPHYAPVPAPRYEAVPPPPGAAYVWRPGHWQWVGNGYVWRRGIYVIRRASWHQWVNGHWTLRGNTWFWTPGHWN